MSRIYPLMLLCSALQPTLAQEPHVRYIQNKGQWPEQVRFKTDLSEAAMFLENNGLTWVRYEPGAADRVHDLNHHPELEQDFSLKGHAWKMYFVGASASATITTEEKQSYYLNYFIGNDPAKWAGFVPVFHGVTYNDLWPGIDLRWHGAKAQIKYDLMVNAGADPSTIGFEYEGLDGISIDENGDLVLKTSVGDMMEMKPVAWYADTRQPIACAYRVSDGRVGFSFPAGIDPDRDVVIDPLLYGATYSGGVNSSNYGHCAAYDDEGHIYGGAQNFGIGFPATLGAFQTTPGSGVTDIVVNKFSGDATNLLWATYIGGSSDEKPHSMVVNSAQELSILGSCTGGGYPTSASAFQDSSAGGTDIVITRLNTTASALIGSTYIGGSAQDGRNTFTLTVYYGDAYRGEIMLDASDNVWVASCSQSTDFPVSSDAFQDTLGGAQDGVVLGLSGTCSTLIGSTYLGGTTLDNALGLRFSTAGELYVCGATNSIDFPITPGAYSNTYQGGDMDGYVVRFSGGVTILDHGTYFGTGGVDVVGFIDLNAAEEVYLFGPSDGGMTIDPPGTYGQAGGTIFIAKLNPVLSSTTLITTLGTGGFGYAMAPVAFGVDSCGRIYISGFNPSSTWACTPDALYAYSGEQFYMAAYDSDMSGMLYGGFYGGDHVDGGTSRFDESGILYQAVCSGGNSMQTTAGAFASSSALAWNLGLFKLDLVVDPCGLNVGHEEMPQTDIGPMDLWPVPAEHVLHISGRFSATGMLRADLIDATGRVVMEKTFEPSRPLDISRLTSGMYSLLLLQDRTVIAAGRFIKE